MATRPKPRPCRSRRGHHWRTTAQFAGILCDACGTEVSAVQLSELGFVKTGESVAFGPNGMRCGCGRDYSVYDLARSGVSFPRHSKDEELDVLRAENSRLRERLGERLVDEFTEDGR